MKLTPTTGIILPSIVLVGCLVIGYFAGSFEDAERTQAAAARPLASAPTPLEEIVRGTEMMWEDALADAAMGPTWTPGDEFTSVKVPNVHVVEASATVDRTGHRLTVHALNSSVGVPLFLAALELDGTLGDRYSAIVDAENRAHFHDLAPGPYRLIGTHGLTVVDVTVPSDAVEFEALVPDSLKVLSIDKDSLAAAAGLQEGDVVIAVDGSPLSTIEGLKKFGGLASKATAQMTVVRGADLIPLAFVGDASEAAGHGMRVEPWASSVLR